MRLTRILTPVLFVFLGLGCGSSQPTPSVVSVPTETSMRLAPPPREVKATPVEPQPTPMPETVEPAQPYRRPISPEEARRLTNASPLPPAPKLAADSTHIDLLPSRAQMLPALAAVMGPSIFDQQEIVPDNRLILERTADGRRRVLFSTEVCLREGPLEVFVCKRGTKEHEAILRVAIDARFLHASLIAAGGKVGTPVQFVNPRTMEPEYKPATGSKVRVLVNYIKDGKTHTHPAQEWVENLRTNETMKHEWVFAGSRFMKFPDDPEGPDYYCANNGDVIGISNSFDAMLDVPVEVTRDDSLLFFQAKTDRIPPVLSRVWVILEVEKQ